MKIKSKAKNLFEQEMQDPGFRDRYDKEHEFFKIEVQLLTALERLGLTYEQLAKQLHTSRGNISRDLQGGIADAKLGRIRRMAHELGLTFVPLMVQTSKAKALLPKLEKLIAA